jgi:hypothetical protein
MCCGRMLIGPVHAPLTPSSPASMSARGSTQPSCHPWGALKQRVAQQKPMAQLSSQYSHVDDVFDASEIVRV